MPSPDPVATRRTFGDAWWARKSCRAGASASFRGQADLTWLDEGTDVEDLPESVDDVLEVDFGARPFARGGLRLDLHLGRFDLQGHASLLVPFPEVAWGAQAGVALLWRWDRVVPAVLPGAYRPISGEDPRAAAGHARDQGPTRRP